MTQHHDSQQYAVLTEIGAEKLNQLMTGQLLDIKYLALGDGGGSAVVPVPSGTRLINEIGRESITETATAYFGAGAFMDAIKLSKYKGQWLREVGLIDADGDLIVWACYAPTLIAMFNEKTIMVHLPITYQDKINISVDTSKKYVTFDEFNLFKVSMQTQDYSRFATQLADTSNVIYADLPRSVMAQIPVGIMQSINDITDYPLFTPRADISYVLAIQTNFNDLGFEQTLTIIEKVDDKQDVNLTFKRSGRNFADATQWDSMLGLPPNKDLVVDTLFFRNDVRAVNM